MIQKLNAKFSKAYKPGFTGVTAICIHAHFFFNYLFGWNFYVKYYKYICTFGWHESWQTLIKYYSRISESIK